MKNVLNADVEIIDNKSELRTFLLCSPDEYSVVFSSSVFVDVDEAFISVLKENLGEYSVVSAEGQLLCNVFNNKNLALKLSENNHKKSVFSDETESQIVYEGYTKNIKKALNYKCLLDDVLHQKTTELLPEIAQGIFAEDKIPEGNFVIIPPVYFDVGVQVEDGAVIGPGAIIMADTLVSKKSEIRNSFVSKGAYVSSNCLIEGAFLCENVNVRRNSVVLGGSVLGHNSTVGEETIIENNSLILPYTKVDESKQNYINFKKETHESPAGFYGYSPEKAALLGAALGKVFNKPRIAVASDGELNSTSLKLALLSGLMTTGASCYDFGNTFLSALHYYMEFCELDCSVFVSGNRSGTVITVFTKKSYSLTSSQYYNTKALMVSGKIERCTFDECKKINQIHGMTRMYIQNIIKDFNSPLEFVPVFKCCNKRILSVVELAASKIGCKTEDKELVINLNSEGTKVTFEYDNVIYPHSKIREIVSFFSKENVLSDLRDFDAVILSFELLRIFNDKHLDFKSALKLLPKFYVVEDYLNYNGSMHELINKIGDRENVQYKSGDLFLEKRGSKVLVNRLDNGLRIIAKASSSEAAQEIVGDLIRNISSL